MNAKATHYLVAIAGPALEPLALVAREKPSIIGRHEDCDLLLPASADKVSRLHAQLAFREGRWQVCDLKSRWGTFLNGRMLPPEEPVALHPGDLLHIAPWTFTLSATPVGRGLKLASDENHMGTMVRTLHGGAGGSLPGRPLGEDLLALLLESAAGIHNANDEKSLAQVLLDTAARGTGLGNGAVLRPLDVHGTFEVIASRSAGNLAGAASYSRSLIRAASGGDLAEFSAGESSPTAQSIAEMKVVSAICVPLMLGATVAAYLYLDSRRESFAALRPAAHGAAFCAALGRIGSLALANLKRVEMERRAALVEAELNAGAEAQRFILPRRSAAMGRFSYIGESKPGQYVGGDFFDILALDDNRLAVALADVAGKGIPASVLMAAAQGYLHAALQQQSGGGDLSAAVSALNNFVCPRCPANKFLTIFVAVIDAKNATLTYIDAGHGYALVRTPGCAFTALGAESSLPIGIAADTYFRATTIAFPGGSELLIVSDGIIEQTSPAASAGPAGTEPERQQFELSGVESSLAGASTDPIAALFQAVITFAASSHLADDATALLVTYI